MVDIPGNATTTATITLGGTANGTLETVGDHDWYKINLTAGQLITVTLTGLTLDDPYLRIYDSGGNLIFENDDINTGVVTDSRISFEVPANGVYYIDAGAWEDNYAGTFQLSVQTYTPPPVWTIDQVADYLTTGFWGGTSRAFDVTQGESLTVNISALTAAGKNYALQALALWTDIIGVTFNVVATGGQIVFDDNEDGAFAESTYGGGFITSSHVNVDTEWLSYYGTGTNSYAFQTYIHEIGHALGLGHAGPYNGTGDYFSQALFANDGWPTSIMSYFSQNDGTYFDNLNFSYAFAVTPMMADIAAMQDLYGLSTTTRTGNTTYGFNSTAGNPIFDISVNPNIAYAIYDSGGTDTLNFSNYNGTQLINLNQETFSNVGGKVGTVSIARGTVIENAIGGSGADTIIGNSMANQLDGNGGNDTLTGGGGTDKFIFESGDGQDIITDVAAGEIIAIKGYASAQSVTQSGANVVVILSATDRITFQNTTVSVVQAALQFGNAPSVVPTEGNDTLTGTAGDDTINALGGNDSVTSLAGNDTLNGGAGADTMLGGIGNDTYVVDNAGDVITEAAGEGTDLVNASVSHTLSNNVENLTLTGSGTISGTGNALANRITGNSAANTLSGGAGDDNLIGGAGADTMLGGIGNDTYNIDNGGDVVTEAAGEGTDLVNASVTHTLSGNVENLTLTGSGAISGTGNALANRITGNSAANTLSGGAGNDILVGGAGADTMIGGTGNDAFNIDNSGDVVTELAGEGTDTAYSSISYTISDNVENLSLTGSGAIAGTGNASANSMLGNSSANTLSGGAGDDTLNGGAGADTMLGGIGNDTYVVDNVGDVVTEAAGEGTDLINASVTHTLSGNVENLTLTGSGAISGTGNALANRITGNSAANTLSGGAGDDNLIGGAGADTMLGGIGNDTYVVDNAGDVITEAAGEGTDLVNASVSHTLSNNVENLTLTGSGTISGTGNALANRITGNSAANTLSGGAGDDNLIGGAGADTMLGGIGNDTYNIDNGGDVVTEAAGEGTDLVNASVTHTLSGNVENLTLTGSGAISGTGNALANRITGNSAANTLSGGAGNDILVGGAGADTMIGGTGNDAFNIDNSGDVVTELAGEGTDTAYASISYTISDNVENLSLTGSGAIAGTGNASANSMLGNSSANTLSGGAGDDTLNGGAGEDNLYGGIGSDVLTGGTGADKFIFDTALNGIENVDQIRDFSAGEDVLILDRSIFAGVAGDGPLSASAFRLGTAATEADDRVIYDSLTGNLYYDVDGNGATEQVLFAQITAGSSLTNEDFQLIA